MKLRTINIAFIFIFAATAAAFGQSGATSVYTSTDTKDCRAVKLAQEDSYKGICPGVGGYKLELLEGDIRQTINVIFPTGKRAELSLWTTVSSGFSAVGPKIEWRGSKVGAKFSPYALIIRYNVADAEDSTKTISYLAVAKIAKGNKACVTDVVDPQAKQNEKAREMADAAASKACKE